MGDVMKSWLRDRLGIMIDLSPDIFGHFAKDGTLMAKILHSYDIINDNQLQTITSAYDPALCRMNLKHLRLWLKFINIDCDQDCINDISKGKGTAALQLFYKVFLSLEDKDKLHFITLQREREKYVPTSTKFVVTKVLKEDLMPQPSSFENHLADPLIKNIETIKWYKNKFSKNIDKTEKDRFQRCQELLESSKIRNDCENTLNTNISSDTNDNLFKRMDFSTRTQIRDHVNKNPKLKENIDLIKINLEPVHTYDDWVKKRKRQVKTATAFKNKVRTKLFIEISEKLHQDQNTEVNTVIAKKVLKQSQYEKRMMRKLFEIHQERTRIANNRKIVGDLVQKAQENESSLEQQRVIELVKEEINDIRRECERMCELRQKLHEDKIRKHHEKIFKESEDIIDAIVNIAIQMIEYLKINGKEVSISTLKEWTKLFVRKELIFGEKSPEIEIDAVGKYKL